MSTPVLDLLRSPRNVGRLDPCLPGVGTGVAGSVAGGALIRISVRVGEAGVIEEARFQAYGCADAIASASLAATLVQGMSVAAAGRVRAARIARELELPPGKVYCSTLATDAVRAAIEGATRGHPARPVDSNRKGTTA